MRTSLVLLTVAALCCITAAFADGVVPSIDEQIRMAEAARPPRWFTEPPAHGVVISVGTLPSQIITISHWSASGAASQALFRLQEAESLRLMNRYPQQEPCQPADETSSGIKIFEF